MESDGRGTIENELIFVLCNEQNKKNENPFIDCHFGSNVGMITGSSDFFSDLSSILTSQYIQFMTN